jgi:hypothetical protein
MALDLDYDRRARFAAARQTGADSVINLRHKADSAVRDLSAAIPQILDEPNRDRAAAIIESYLLEAYNRAIIESLRQASERSARTARACCSADRDLAHKLSEEIEKANLALIANLSGMR